MEEKWILCGFESQEINVLVIDPINTSNIYIATNEGVFKSADNGVTWKTSDANLQQGQTEALAINPTNPSILYGLRLKSSSMALYNSTNGGDSWNETKTDINQDHYKYWSGKSSLVIDPKNPSTLYLIGPKLWVSPDRGEHWRQLGVLSESALLTLVIDPLNSSILYLGTSNNDAKKSTDGGQNWGNLAILYEPFSVFSIAIEPTNSSVLYAGTPMGVHKSTDGGASWNEANNGLDLRAYGPGAGLIAIDWTTPATVYAAVGGSLYKSANGGNSWGYADTGLPKSNVIKQLVIDPKNSSILYAGGKHGLWRVMF